MPYLPNILTVKQAFSPLGLAAAVDRLRPWLTFVTAALAVLLIFRLALCGLRADRQGGGGDGSGRDPIRPFFGTAAVILLGLTLATGLRFDRYLLMLVPLLVPLLLPRGRQFSFRGWLSVLIVLAMGTGSTYFVDQRVRDFSCLWQAAESLVAEGFAPCQIDGGFAFNGSHCYEALAARYGRDRGTPFHPGVNPDALVVARPVDPTNARRRLGQASSSERSRDCVCANRAGLRPYVVEINYRRGNP